MPNNLKTAVRTISLSTALVILNSVLQAQPHDRAVPTAIPSPAVSTGSIAGRLTPHGSPASAVAGTQVLLRRVDEAAPVATVLAGADGTFVFYDLVPGEYSVEPDAATLSPKFKQAPPVVLRVAAGRRADAELRVDARRSIAGLVLLDTNSDGLCTAGKDSTVANAELAVGGAFGTSSDAGVFRLTDLPAGRTSVVVTRRGDARTTHIILDLADGPVTDRIVNICIRR